MDGGLIVAPERRRGYKKSSKSWAASSPWRPPVSSRSSTTGADRDGRTLAISRFRKAFGSSCAAGREVSEIFGMINRKERVGALMTGVGRRGRVAFASRRGHRAVTGCAGPPAVAGHLKLPVPAGRLGMGILDINQLSPRTASAWRRHGHAQATPGPAGAAAAPAASAAAAPVGPGLPVPATGPPAAAGRPPQPAAAGPASPAGATQGLPEARQEPAHVGSRRARAGGA